MVESNRKWTIYVIHHSHTDIGYTDRQEKIERYHVDFIRQAIAASEQIRSGQRPEWQGFCWTCETFWPVERFLGRATPEWKQRFVEALQHGDIELSANYLNFTELIDDSLSRKLIQRAVDYGQAQGVRVDSAMTADINGYGWGFAQGLVDAGVENLFSCVHTHHGMYPMGYKQMPFWWETQNGNKLLVWNGEHYHYGNELGLVPNTLGGVIGNPLSSPVSDEHMAEAASRITAYLKQLECEDYSYDFAPLMVSGLFTDNGPPNPRIMEFISKWNENYGDSIQIRMTTLTKFFRHVRTLSGQIPVYRGDWPDWWTDGVGSTPLHTQLFRDAQRTLRLVHRLDPEQEHIDPNVLDQAEQNLALYAEHTWGYSSSVHEPWNPNVQALGVRKEAYAAEAHRIVYGQLDEVLEAQGEAGLVPGRAQRYKVMNPFDAEVAANVPLYIDHWEPRRSGLVVVDETDGEALPHQLAPASRGVAVWVGLHLKPLEQKTLLLKSDANPGYIPTSRFQRAGADGVVDISTWDTAPLGKRTAAAVSESVLETPFLRIGWDAGRGITSWWDKTGNRELIRPDFQHAAFAPVYEVTPSSSTGSMTDVRRKMGRNRKGIDVVRTVGRLTSVTKVATGPLFHVVELHYELPGTKYFVVGLTAYLNHPRVDVRVRILKDSVWNPENLYISLPFTADAEAKSQLWLEKSGVLVRPRVDQLPGTLTDFYSVQEGVAYVGEHCGLAIGLPDNPLAQLGRLEHGDRLLHGHPALSEDPAHLYSWVLNNIWETNFKATTGGFYEFRYHLCWGREIDTPEAAIAMCHQMNTGVVSFRLADGV